MQSTADAILNALHPFKLKSEGRNKYRCNSPFRPGSDSLSFTLTIDDGEHGAFHDHHASANPSSGSLYELATLLNIPLPAVTPVADTKRGYSGIKDYAEAHGVTVDVLNTWQWREISNKGRAMLLIPTRTGNRYRYIDGKKGTVYFSDQGYERCWYGFNNNLDNILKLDCPLVICNGEISTIAGQWAGGLAAIAMTAGEKAELPINLLNELKGRLADYPNVEIIVAMDCDKDGRKAGRGLAKQLLEEGFKARAVDLGLGNKGDLADFCMLHGYDTLAALRSCPSLPEETESSDRDYVFYGIDEVMKMPPVEWLIPGVLPKRGLCMVYGASGAGKSFYTLAMAFDLAHQTPCLYVVAEGEAGMPSRVQALVKHHKSKPKDLTFVFGSVDLFRDDELSVFKSLSAKYKPSLIVIDTLAMCTGDANENDTRDMKTIIQGCKKMAKELDSAVLLVHHTNKEGKQARGNGRLFNDLDTVIRIARMDDVIAIESQKTKDKKKFKTQYLREVTVPLGYTDNTGAEVTSLVLLPADKVVTDNSKITELQRAVLDVIALEPHSSFGDISAIVEVGRGVISRCIKQLEQRGYLLAWDGQQRKITNAGQMMLSDSDSDESVVSQSALSSNGKEKPESVIQGESVSQQSFIPQRQSSHYEAGL